jgi:hypothetical protein
MVWMHRNSQSSHYSVQNVSSCCLLSKNTKVKEQALMYVTVKNRATSVQQRFINSEKMPVLRVQTTENL